MRRDRIIEAIDRLKEALHEAQIRDVFNSIRNEPSTNNTTRIQKILSSYSIFSQHYMEFGEEEKQLMTLFGLDALINVNFWSSMLEKDPNLSTKVITDIDVGVYNVMFVMPKMRELLVRESDKEELVIQLEDGDERTVKRLRIHVSENGNELTETFVLTNVIKAIEDFYEIMFFLHKTDFVALTIGSFDSGIDKVMDFFGSGIIIDDMSSIIANVWQRVKHSTEDNIRYQIEVAMMACGFIARVKEAQAAKFVTEEEAQRIIRTVSKSVEILLRNGAYTDDMEKVEDVRASDVLIRKAEQIEYQAQPASPESQQDIQQGFPPVQQEFPPTQPEQPTAQHAQPAPAEEVHKPSFMETGAGPFAVLSSASNKARPH